MEVTDSFLEKPFTALKPLHEGQREAQDMLCAMIGHVHKVWSVICCFVKA